MPREAVFQEMAKRISESSDRRDKTCRAGYSIRIARGGLLLISASRNDTPNISRRCETNLFYTPTIPSSTRPIALSRIAKVERTRKPFPEHQNPRRLGVWLVEELDMVAGRTDMYTRPHYCLAVTLMGRDKFAICGRCR